MDHWGSLGESFFYPLYYPLDYFAVPRGYEDITPKKPLIALYDAFYISGFVLMGSCIMTAWLAPSIKRGRTWFLFIFSWVLTSLANFMLLGQQTGPEPHTALCLIQSLFIYGAPVLLVYFMSSPRCFLQHIAAHPSAVQPSSCTSGLQSNLYPSLDMIWPPELCNFGWVVTFYISAWPNGSQFLAIPMLCFMIMMLVVGIVRLPSFHSYTIFTYIQSGIVNPSLVERDATGMYCHLRVSYP